MNDIYTMRTELANDFAVAGAKLLSFTATGGALAAIPETEPQQYAVAGTLESIQKVLPADEPSHPQRRLRHGDRPTEPLSFDEAAETVIPAPLDPLHIALGQGEIEIGQGHHGSERLPAILFGRNGAGAVGIETEGDRHMEPGECIAAVTFENWESLDVVAEKLAELRARIWPDAPIAAHIARQAQPTDRDADALDAARYRYLRGSATDIGNVIDKEFAPGKWEYRAGEELDTAIDAAIRALKGKSGSEGAADE